MHVKLMIFVCVLMDVGARALGHAWAEFRCTLIYQFKVPEKWYVSGAVCQPCDI